MGANPKIKVLLRRPIGFSAPAAGFENFFRLEHWRVSRDGVEDDRIIWKRGDFVVVLAVTPEGKLVAISEYKQAVEQTLLCFPAGTVKKGEDPIHAGLRELLEESGYAPQDSTAEYIPVPLFNSPDKSTERHFVVIIPNVVKVAEPKPERAETILETVLLTPEQAHAQMRIALHLGALSLYRNR